MHPDLWIYDKCNHRCAYCGCTLEYNDMQVDHAQPLRCGGADEDSNMLTVEKYREYIEGIPERLSRDSIPFAVGKRFGMVKENHKPVVFWFEELNRGGKMTEKEALEVLKTHNDKCSGCDKLCDDLCKPAVAMAIKALTEIQRYRVIEKRLDGMFEGQLPLEHYVDRLEEALKEPGKPHPVNARILTYEDADMWEAYKSIGTPEECRAAVEKHEQDITDFI